MKKRIIATVLTAACALTGCSTSVPDLSKLDAGKASEFMAGELLKHDSKYAYGLDYDRSILNPTPTPTPIVTPAPAPTETAAVQSAEPGQAAAGKDGEAEVITVPLTKLYGIPGVSVDFVSAKLKSSLGADYAYCKKRGTLFGMERYVYRDFTWFRSDTFVISQRFFSFRLSFSDWMYSIDLLDHDLSVYPKTCEISRKYLTS